VKPHPFPHNFGGGSTIKSSTWAICRSGQSLPANLHAAPLNPPAALCIMAEEASNATKKKSAAEIAAERSVAFRPAAPSPSVATVHNRLWNMIFYLESGISGRRA